MHVSDLIQGALQAGIARCSEAIRYSIGNYGHVLSPMGARMKRMGQMSLRV